MLLELIILNYTLVSLIFNIINTKLTLQKYQINWLGFQMIQNFLTILLTLLIVIFPSCRNQKSPEFKDKKSSENKIQIAITNDIDFFNPLYSNDVY